MTKLTQKPAVGSIGAFDQVYGATPYANTANPTSGTGSVDNSFLTYVGQRFDTADGRELVLVSNGTSAIAAGKLVAAPAEVTGYENLAITVPSNYPATAGLTQVYVTNGATVVKENELAGGLLIVSAGTGIGQTLQISSHKAAAASGNFVVNLLDPIQTTLDATSTVTLVPNVYANVVESPTTAASTPVGATLGALSASTAATFDSTSGALTKDGVNQYGLIVKHGNAGILVDSTAPAVGAAVGASTATAGAVGTAASATTLTVAQIGIANQTTTSAEVASIYLTL